MVLFFRLTESSTSLFWILLIVFIDALNSFSSQRKFVYEKKTQKCDGKATRKIWTNIGVGIHLYNLKSNLVKVKWVGRVF